LGFTTIRSPIDGKAGLAKAQLGDLVGPSFGALTSVSKINPIRANFAVSEQLVYKSLQRDAAAGGESERSKFTLELLLASGDVYPEKGRIKFTGNQVDVKTGTIEVVGEFSNPNGLLLPGMFARVRAIVRIQSGALLVPQRAVAEMQGRRLVALIGTDDKISIRPVTVGETVGDQWIIEGPRLKPGDRIVAEGIQKVRDGGLVKPIPFTATAANSP
jgi:membrane fusion protein (multidrug efflux system)